MSITGVALHSLLHVMFVLRISLSARILRQFSFLRGNLGLPKVIEGDHGSGKIVERLEQPRNSAGWSDQNKAAFESVYATCSEFLPGAALGMNLL